MFLCEYILFSHMFMWWSFNIKRLIKILNYLRYTVHTTLSMATRKNNPQSTHHFYYRNKHITSFSRQRYTLKTNKLTKKNQKNTATTSSRNQPPLHALQQAECPYQNKISSQEQIKTENIKRWKVCSSSCEEISYWKKR